MPHSPAPPAARLGTTTHAPGPLPRVPALTPPPTPAPQSRHTPRPTGPTPLPTRPPTATHTAPKPGPLRPAQRRAPTSTILRRPPRPYPLPRARPLRRHPHRVHDTHAHPHSPKTLTPPRLTATSSPHFTWLPNVLRTGHFATRCPLPQPPEAPTPPSVPLVAPPASPTPNHSLACPFLLTPPPSLTAGPPYISPVLPHRTPYHPRSRTPAGTCVIPPP
ncbi:hypothetical protein CesoFtcFv8_021425 [Champsocephalus esox]|nr:hypothetical protein CesoFtcFv8_021425 [Champsocephalus esox]